MEIFYIFAIWGIIIAIAPFGIWTLKSRMRDVEERLQRLELLERSMQAQQQREAKRDLPPPIPVAEFKPASSAQAAAFAQSITQRKEILPAAKREPEVTATPEPLPSMKDFMSPPPIPVTEPKQQETKSYDSPWAAQQASVEEEKDKPYIYEPAEFRLPGWITRSLTGGRLFVTLGLLLLFMGSAMLFKYAAQFITIPLEARFMGVAIGAVGLIAFGSRQMGKRRDYGLYLQGGGLGLLFLTTFTAFRYYHLIPPTLALALLVLIGGATFALSVINDAMALSVLAVVGGFLAPIITATGGGSHIALFSYYLIINLVIFAIAWKKSWRVLNTIGFVFTFAIGSLWGGQYYVPQYYASVQMFLLAYFLLYTGIGLLYASRSETNFTNPIDFASVWGVPLIGCGLQFKLVETIVHGTAISSALLGLFYASLYLMIERSSNEGLKKLREPYMWLSLLFFTLAIPFAFSSHTTAMLWAMEGTALLAMMRRTGDRFYGYAGVVVLFASNLFMLPALKLQGQGTPFLNEFFLSALVMALTHITAAHMLRVSSVIRESLEGAVVMSVVGMGWWFGAGCAEIATLPALNGMFLMPCLAFATASAVVGYLITPYVKAPLMDKPISLTLAAIIGSCAVEIAATQYAYHPMQHYGYIALPLAFAAHYLWLWKEKETAAPFHVGGFLTLIVLVGFEIGTMFHGVQTQEVQKIAGWILAAAAGLFLLSLKPKKPLWLVDVLLGEHRLATALPLIYWLLGLTVYSFTQAVTLGARDYIPLLNTVELSELASFIAMIAFALRTDAGSNRERVFAFATLIGFGFINALMLRTISGHFGIAYFSEYMWHLPEAMTALTILWTLLSMGAMILSSRIQIRAGWAMGAALLGVVVVKLFVMDLANIGTLSRIISFMGVGMLSLLLGYIAPMPVRKKAD